MEPLFAALAEAREEKRVRPAGRRSLLWKLFWAAVVFSTLLALVLKQAF